MGQYFEGCHGPDVSDQTLQVCVLGVVETQPGALVRMTAYGEAPVCNALLRQGGTSIRCSFWRALAGTLAAFNVGDPVAIYQAVVKKMDASTWEIRATESTSVEPCPDDLRPQVVQGTNLAEAASRVLTAVAAVDYDTATATPASVGALAAVMMPGVARELPGVFEVHSVAILGLSSVLADDSFAMRCCSRCKRQVQSPLTACAEHPGAGSETRCVAKVAFADHAGCSEAMIYHDALARFVSVPDATAALPACTRKLRSTVWSMRLVYRQQARVRSENYLEIKALIPTLTAEGVAATWSVPSLPVVCHGQPCPFSRCADLTYDAGLGAACVRGVEVTAARLWVEFQPLREEEDIAKPEGTGLRVSRRVKCAADPADTQEYMLTQAGLSGSVQWLMRARDGSKWFILASKRAALATFAVLGSMEVTDYPGTSVEAYFMGTLNRTPGPVVTLPPALTPTKRKHEIMSHSLAPATSSAGSFSARALL